MSHVIAEQQIVQLFDGRLKLVRAAKAFDWAAAKSCAELLELPPAQVSRSADHRREHNDQRSKRREPKLNVRFHVLRKLSLQLTCLPRVPPSQFLAKS